MYRKDLLFLLSGGGNRERYFPALKNNKSFWGTRLFQNFQIEREHTSTDDMYVYN